MNQNVSLNLASLIAHGRTQVLSVLAGMTIILLTGSPASAHGEFKDAMEERYKLKSVSCKACHTGNKDKKIRNAFGKLLHAELKDKKITENYHASKEQGDEAHEKYEKEMVRLFLVALKTVEKKQLTFAALVNAGLLNGTRLDTSQVDVDGLTIKLVTAAEPKPDKKQSGPVGKGAKVIKGQIENIPASGAAVEKTKAAEQPKDTPAASGDDDKPAPPK